MLEMEDSVKNNAKEYTCNRLMGLDLLRVVAVLMVFLFHSNIHLKCNYGILNNFIEMGAVFMTLFFMLSGFVLYYTNQTKRLLNLNEFKNFYLKRLLGIMPVYWVIAFIYSIYSVISKKESIIISIILFPVEALGLQSVFSSLFDISHNGGTWFVSCIVLCYILFPFVLHVISHIKLKSKIFFCIFLFGVLLYSPVIVGVLDLNNIYSNPFFRICEFIIGMLLCSIWTNIKEENFYKKYIANGYILILVFILLILEITFAKMFHLPNVTYMLYSAISIPFFTVLVLGLSGMAFEKLKNCKMLKYFVEISYVFFFAQFFTWPITRWILNFFGGGRQLCQN